MSRAAGAVGRRRPTYLRRMAPAVRAHFATAVDLPTFLAKAGTLSAPQRLVLLRQALVLMEHNYVHLGLKRAMHAVDPVQRLKLLLQGEQNAAPEALCCEAEFHRRLTDVFMSVRDLHTNYLLPEPFGSMQAFLPFFVEAFFEDGQRRYLVPHVVPGFSHPTFVAGVEVRFWNGIPIELAVQNNASRYAGSNPAAFHARGVATLTSRVLRLAPPPDEAWVIVGYRTLDGQDAEIRLDWMVAPPLPDGAAGGGSATVDAGCATLGIDIEQHLRQEMRKALFVPAVVEATTAACNKVRCDAAFHGLNSKLPDVFEARPVATRAGLFGYLRIRKFTPNPDVFLPELMRLLEQLPDTGLIIDVRGNGGGVIMNGERMLQLLTPRRIEPEPLQFVNSPLNLEICNRNSPGGLVDLGRWVGSMKLALQTGASHSAAFPITDPDECNAIGQKYFGPVVLVVDGLCYSTTDIFAAGFQDHEIGPVLGTDDNTGAGGANVWTHDLLARLLPGNAYEPLPNGAGMRVSMRRSLRVGLRAGTPVEELGVAPDPGHRHRMTRRDLTDGNVDLLERAGELLAAMPSRAEPVASGHTSAGGIAFKIRTRGISRIDVYADDRPVFTADVDASSTTLGPVALPAACRVLELRGFDQDRLAARLRLDLGAARTASPLSIA